MVKLKFKLIMEQKWKNKKIKINTFNIIYDAERNTGNC